MLPMDNSEPKHVAYLHFPISAPVNWVYWYLEQSGSSIQKGLPPGYNHYSSEVTVHKPSSILVGITSHWAVRYWLELRKQQQGSVRLTVPMVGRLNGSEVVMVQGIFILVVSFVAWLEVWLGQHGSAALTIWLEVVLLCYPLLTQLELSLGRPTGCLTELQVPMVEQLPEPQQPRHFSILQSISMPTIVHLSINLSLLRSFQSLPSTNWQPMIAMINLRIQNHREDSLISPLLAEFSVFGSHPTIISRIHKAYWKLGIWLAYFFSKFVVEFFFFSIENNRVRFWHFPFDFGLKWREKSYHFFPADPDGRSCPSW